MLVNDVLAGFLYLSQSVSITSLDSNAKSRCFSAYGLRRGDSA